MPRTFKITTMETIVVSKDSKLMQMIRKAKARKATWQDSIKGELEAMQKELATNQEHLRTIG